MGPERAEGQLEKRIRGLTDVSKDTFVINQTRTHLGSFP
jgi:hypothetical protein